MSEGIKIVTPNSGTNTDNPQQIVIDTKDLGSMKILRVIKFLSTAITDSYTNHLGVFVGRFIYNHGLGYPPAFLVFRHLTNGTFTEILPSYGPLGGPENEAYSDSSVVVVDGISPSSNQYLILVVFAENMDATT